MSKRFDAKKHRAVFHFINGYEFPATRVFLVAFLLMPKIRASMKRLFGSKTAQGTARTPIYHL